MRVDKVEFPEFKPGEGVGSCLPVDPYYLTTKQGDRYHPQLILAGRR